MNKELKENIIGKLVYIKSAGFEIDDLETADMLNDFFSKEIDKVRNETIVKALGLLTLGTMRKGSTYTVIDNMAIEKLKELYDTTK